jgi:hypothetical protein
MFYHSSGISTLLRKKDITATLLSPCGIYTFDSEKPIMPNTEIPPFVSPARTELAWDVGFYNVGNATAETTRVMIRHDDGCYFDVAQNAMTVEFRKTSGNEAIKSIVIGRDFAAKTQAWKAQMADPRMPADFLPGPRSTSSSTRSTELSFTAARDRLQLIINTSGTSKRKSSPKQGAQRRTTARSPDSSAVWSCETPCASAPNHRPPPAQAGK